MKKWIACLLCVVLLLFSMPLTVLAEPVDEGTAATQEAPATDDPTAPVDDPTDPTDEPTTPPTEKPTDPTDEPTVPPTEKPTEPPTEKPTEKPTDPPTTPPTNAPLKDMRTNMMLYYENQQIVVRISDEQGQPVALAPVAISVDGKIYSAQTDQNGRTALPVGTEAREVRASMMAFHNTVYKYAAASASVVLTNGQTDPSAPTSKPTAPTTTPTGKPTVDHPTTTERTDTDASGTVETTVTNEGTSADPTGAQDTVTRPENGSTTFSRSLAIGLMVLGGLLLLAAIALVVIFLVLRSRDAKQEAADEENTDEERSASQPTVPGNYVEQFPESPAGYAFKEHSPEREHDKPENTPEDGLREFSFDKEFVRRSDLDRTITSLSDESAPTEPTSPTDKEASRAVLLEDLFRDRND